MKLIKRIFTLTLLLLVLVASLCYCSIQQGRSDGRSTNVPDDWAGDIPDETIPLYEEEDADKVLEHEGFRANYTALRIATTGVGSVGCEYGVIGGEATDYLYMQDMSEGLAALSLPRPNGSDHIETACFEFYGERPKDIRLLCAKPANEPIEVHVTDDVFYLFVDIGECYYFAYLRWEDNLAETVFFRAKVFTY
jgi:hypothetical protein